MARCVRPPYDPSAAGRRGPSTTPRRRVRRAANDNSPARRDPALLRAALLHFARHGMAAASVAASQAMAAAASGDNARFVHWRDVCALIDPRHAAELADPSVHWRR